MHYGEVIGIVLGVIGTISSIWFLHERLFPPKRLSWRVAKDAAENIANKMLLEGFSPTVIVGIGRGGAIMGAMISGCLGHKPLIVIDRKYDWTKGRRMDDMILRLEFHPSLVKKVLLVAGEVHTGNTMRLYYDYFKDHKAKSIKRAVLYNQLGGTEPIEYIGWEGTRDLQLPWMFSKNYIRDSRSEEDAKPNA